MKMIAAVDEKGGIGKNGGLLCHIPSDLRYFKEKTLGKPVIMGYNTLLSLPRGEPLKGRMNLILSSRCSADAVSGFENAKLFRSAKSLFDALGEEEKNEAFVIGGASVYRQFIKYCDTLYVTRILKSFDADVFFPDVDEKVWYEAEKSGVFTENGIPFCFIVYKRRSAPESFPECAEDENNNTLFHK